MLAFHSYSSATANADLWDVPVAPGETFRWAFVTSWITDAQNSDIYYYNRFVNDVADAAGTPITGVVSKSSIADIEWKAIASTLYVNAQDNIGGVSPTPIYTPLGDLVAYGTDDLFDAPIAAPLDVTESGPSQQIYVMVWTGTRNDGITQGPLGTFSAATTGNLMSRYSWARWDWQWPDVRYPLYAISEELTVVPAPGALMLAATGLLSSTLGLKRWRRRRQE